MSRERLNPGAWQVDENGQRYRMIGKSAKEYEMILTIDGCQVPESQLEEFHARRKELKAERERKEEEARLAEARLPRHSCPFESGADSSCMRDRCALYVDGCQITNFLKYAPPAKDTKGLRCPFSNYLCRADCAFYNGGCMFTGQLKVKENNNNE